MANGLVLYRDLFEQKGPLLNLINAFAYLIFHTSFLGVFILEVINLTVALFIAAKIIRLFLTDDFVYLILPVFACLPLISSNFEAGGSAEEFSFIFILTLLYLMANYFKNEYPRPLSDRAAMIAGITAGLVSMIKYTMRAYWIAFAGLLILSAIGHRQIVALLRNILLFMLGMMLSILPWILYFASNHAMHDFYDTYVTVNLHCYPTPATLLERLMFIGVILIFCFSQNVIAFLITFFGFWIFGRDNQLFSNRFGRAALPVCILFVVTITYYGLKPYPYYFMAAFPLLLFGLIGIASLFQHKVPLTGIIWKRRILVAVLCTVLVLVTLISSPNVPLMNRSKADYPPYRFADIINRVPDATLFNYGCLDGGTYTTTGITPNVKYFMLNKISYDRYPEMLDEQNRYIREKVTTYVIVRMSSSMDAKAIDIPYLHENYTLVDEMVFPWKSSTFIFFKDALYQVK